MMGEVIVIGLNSKSRFFLPSLVLVFVLGLTFTVKVLLAQVVPTPTYFAGCWDSMKKTLYNVTFASTPPVVPTCKSGDLPVDWANGDILGVDASTGLDGGGASGVVALSLLPNFRLPQNCSNGQIVKWNITTNLWECADTSVYTAGGGLELTGNQFSLADQGITTPKIADGAVSSEKMAPTVLMNPGEGYLTTTSNTLVDVPNANVDLDVPSGKIFDTVVNISGIAQMDDNYFLISINRDGTDIRTYGIGSQGAGVAIPFSFTVKDSGIGGGTHTYKIRAAAISPINTSVFIQKTTIVVQAFAAQ